MSKVPVLDVPSFTLEYAHRVRLGTICFIAELVERLFKGKFASEDLAYERGKERRRKRSSDTSERSR